MDPWRLLTTNIHDKLAYIKRVECHLLPYFLLLDPNNAAEKHMHEKSGLTGVPVSCKAHIGH